MIRKLMILAATGVCAAAMASGVWADDIVVNTSVGSGEVVFAQTDETADITEEELTELVKEAARQAGDLTMIDAFLDAEADVSIKLGAENEMAIKASAIGMADRYEDKGYGSFYYSLEGLGTPQSAQFEAYHWTDGDTHYTSVSDGSAWKTTVEDAVQEVLSQVAGAVDSDQAAQFSLSGLLPNLYEEDGELYYVCVIDKDMLMSAAGSVSEAQGFLPVVESILGDNDVKLTVVVNAETGLLRAVSLNASGIAGQIPGELMGGEGALDFSANQLFVTFLLYPEAQDIEIPEEVLNAPVESEKEKLEDMVSGLGDMLGGAAQ